MVSYIALIEIAVEAQVARICYFPMMMMVAAPIAVRDNLAHVRGACKQFLQRSRGLKFELIDWKREHKGARDRCLSDPFNSPR